LINLDKLHESVWATRLSGGTRSGIVSLEVTAIGKLEMNSGATMLKVGAADNQFFLQQQAGPEHAEAFKKLIDLVDQDKTVRVTGQIADYAGRWPDVLKRQPTKPRRILVTNVQVEE